MIKRNILKKLDKLLSMFPAVAIVGARQTGKTSLANLARPEWRYLDMERSVDRELVERDVDFFFKKHPEAVILDEAQFFPDILENLRGTIDRDRKKNGRFILTGSSSPHLTERVSETLAGRVALLELSPLKANELFDLPLSSFFSIFNSTLSEKTFDQLLALKPNWTIDQLARIWFRGGYPEPQARDDNDFWGPWFENYFLTYINRDLRRYFPGLDMEKYRLFLWMLRDFHAQMMNSAEIARSLSVAEPTVRNYLEIADGTFIWRKLPSFERTVSRSVVKNPRGYIRDSGIFHFISAIATPEQLESSRFLGASFEAFVIEEILRGVACTDATLVEPKFFRTRGGAEVDLVLEGSFGILPIEIKYSTGVDKRDLRSLQDFVKFEKLPLGIVINLGERVEYISEKIIQIPVFCL
jgi:predicted AAA+ superfamily ATPase